MKALIQLSVAIQPCKAQDSLSEVCVTFFCFANGVPKEVLETCLPMPLKGSLPLSADQGSSGPVPVSQPPENTSQAHIWQSGPAALLLELGHFTVFIHQRTPMYSVVVW